MSVVFLRTTFSCNTSSFVCDVFCSHFVCVFRLVASIVDRLFLFCGEQVCIRSVIYVNCPIYRMFLIYRPIEITTKCMPAFRTMRLKCQSQSMRCISTHCFSINSQFHNISSFACNQCGAECDFQSITLHAMCLTSIINTYIFSIYFFRFMTFAGGK